MQRFWGCLLLISLCGHVHVFDCRQGIGMVFTKNKISQTQSMTASEGVVGVVMEGGEWRYKTNRTHWHASEPNAKLSLIKTKHINGLQCTHWFFQLSSHTKIQIGSIFHTFEDTLVPFHAQRLTYVFTHGFKTLRFTIRTAYAIWNCRFSFNQKRFKHITELYCSVWCKRDVPPFPLLEGWKPLREGLRMGLRGSLRGA